jgi:signal transduction histidine kinase
VIQRSREFEERILVVAPRGRDRSLVADVLRKAQCVPEVLGSLSDLVVELGFGAGALVIEEEAIDRETAPVLLRVLESQAAWSDVPVVVLTAPSRLERQTRAMVESLGRSANVILLERPIRTLTLVQTVESALRARRRQYEVRDFQEILERRVAERTAQLETSLKEMDTFSYTIAHDLRAPLRHLSRFAEALDVECGDTLSAECAEYLRSIRSGAARMDTLVQDILRYSRLTRVQVSIAPVDLDSVVSQLLVEMGAELRDRKATVSTELPPGQLLADPILLRQALTNLVSNALKFVPRGLAPAIRIRKEERGPWARIWVEDNGIGIAARHHGRIFEIFERLNNSDEYPGTGIGLAIVRRVVERQGGQVGLESEEGRGSRFWIELPRAGEPAR